MLIHDSTAPTTTTPTTANQRGRAVAVVPASRTTTTASHVTVTRTGTTEVTTTVTQTANRETARDQVGALLAGTHPRCGARCPLLLPLMRSTPSAATYGMIPAVVDAVGGDGILAVRVLWSWLLETTRFYCVEWENEKPQHLVLTFGVSAVLLTLTHGTRWWGQRRFQEILRACPGYLVVLMTAVRPQYCVQDRATGHRALLVDRNCEMPSAANLKWTVMCDCDSRELIVAEIPRKRSTSGAMSINRPTVVPLETCTGRRWTFCFPKFGSANEDHVLLIFNAGESFLELILVDLAQTCSAKTLYVLSSTVPRLDDLDLPDYGLLVTTSYFAVTQQSGVHSFVGKRGDLDRIITVEEGTGRLQSLTRPHLWVSKLNESQFCGFVEGKGTYTVWDANDTSKPVRSQRCASGRKGGQCFVEGGLLFQVSESRKEIIVTEETSGDHVISFQLFTPLVSFYDWFSDYL
ncbi:hypothetical protein Pelo_8798 [Pelomyxa schiedti]|nr:hypothetical protein Pelo_8798 [Pelomyxa schiedti]